MIERARLETVLATSAFVLAAVLWPAVADAHLVTSGLGPVYDGISHLLLTLEDVIPVVAIGLVAGLNGPRAGRRALFVLTLAWFVGGMAGVSAGQPAVPFLVTTISFLTLGALVASDCRLSPTAIGALAAAVGLLHGWFNGAGLAAEGREALGLVGICSAVFVLAAISAARVVTLTAAWSRVAVRVAGSWIAAIGLLMLGWGLRGL